MHPQDQGYDGTLSNQTQHLTPQQACGSTPNTTAVVKNGSDQTCAEPTRGRGGVKREGDTTENQNDAKHLIMSNMA